MYYNQGIYYVSNVYTEAQVDIRNQIRSLWVQHTYWTAAAVVSLVLGLPNADAVVGRLLRNPVDFEKMLTFYYGPRIASRFKDLLTEHLVLAADIINAIKAGDNQRAQELERRWYQNGDAIAEFLGKINPYWSEEQWRAMMRQHLDLVNEEVKATFAGDYEAAAMIVDELEEQAMVMADVMAGGIIRQFGIR